MKFGSLHSYTAQKPVDITTSERKNAIYYNKTVKYLLAAARAFGVVGIGLRIQMQYLQYIPGHKLK